MRKICYIEPSKSGVSYHRLEVPFAKLSENKEFEYFSLNGFSNENLPTEFDIIVLNRLSQQAEPYLEMAKEKGVKIILDLDDDIELPSWHMGYEHLTEPIVRQRIIDTIKIADVVWCASEYLANKVSEYNDNVIVVPNAIDFNQPQFKPQKIHNKRKIIGYIGAANHHQDLSLLQPNLSKLLNQKNYELLYSGVDDEKSMYWQFVFNVFSSNNNLPYDQLHAIKHKNAYNYAFNYNLIDIALAPLEDNEFNRCKSSLKILEAGAFGVPIICSNVEPYKDFIKKCLVIQLGKLDKQINDLLKNPKKIEIMGKNLQKYVKENYNIETINKLRYDSIIDLLD